MRSPIPFRLALPVILALALVPSPHVAAADEAARESRELIFKQQDLEFSTHIDAAQDGYVLLGGAADMQEIRNFPILAAVDKDGTVKNASIFTQKDAKNKISETVGAPPLQGFGHMFPFGDGYAAALSLDWDDDAALPRRTRETLLGVFSKDWKAKTFYKFEDTHSHSVVYLQPVAAAAADKLVFHGVRRAGSGDGTENFIITLNDKLEGQSVIPLPSSCAGKLIFDAVNRRYIALPRQGIGTKGLCIVSEDGKNAHSFALHDGFDLEDGAVGADGALVLVGKRALQPPVIGRMRNRPVQVLRFDKDLHFQSGLELTEALDDLGDAVFAAPGGGYLLAATERESSMIVQTRTGLLRLDDKLGITWGALKDGSGPGAVTSALFRDDGSVSVLVRLGLYKQPTPRELMGRRVMGFNIVSSLNSFALLEFAKDGKEPGGMTTAYQPRTDALRAEDGKLFDAGEKLTLSTDALALSKTEVPLTETKVALEPKTLGRPWDDKQP